MSTPQFTKIRTPYWNTKPSLDRLSCFLCTSTNRSTQQYQVRNTRYQVGASFETGAHTRRARLTRADKDRYRSGLGILRCTWVWKMPVSTNRTMHRSHKRSGEIDQGGGSAFRRRGPLTCRVGNADTQISLLQSASRLWSPGALLGRDRPQHCCHFWLPVRCRAVWLGCCWRPRGGGCLQAR